MEKLSLLAIIFAFLQLVLGFPSIENNIVARGRAALSDDLSPVLKCGPKNIIVTFLKEDLIERKLDIDNVHLKDPACKGKVVGETVSIQFQTDVQYCGTSVSVNTTHAIYENYIRVNYQPSSIIISEDYIFSISCIYPLDMDVSLRTVLKPIMRTININMTGSGQFEVKMALYKDPAYTIPRQVGDALTTNDMLYVAAFISEGDTSSFHLVLKNCFSSPRSDFDDPLKYYIIKNSCKNEKDKTIHVAANGIASFGQFSVQAFKFIGGYSSIFLHCQVHLCNFASTSCFPICTGVPTPDVPGDDDPSIGLGEVVIKDPENMCPGIQCGASYINVTFQKNDLTDALIEIANIQLNQKNCHNLYDDGKTVAIGWPLGVGQCGTTMTTNNTHAIYKNSIYLAPSLSQIIYRKEYYINVSCVYALDLNVSLHKILNPMIRTLTFTLTGVGIFEVTMAAFKDQQYQQPYSTDEIKLYIKTRLFVGVFISQGDIKQFNLVTKSCFATPTNNAQDPINQEIVANSCPGKVGAVEVYSNGISSEGKFSFQIFKFQNYNNIYLHCRVRFCIKNSACEPICPPEGRSADPQDEVITLGPFDLSDGGPDIIPATATKPAPASKVIPKVTTPKDSAGKRMYLDLFMLIAVLLVTVML